MDDADRASGDIENLLAGRIAAARKELPKTYRGICVECDEHSPSLVLGVCAVCRDLVEKANKLRGVR